ncbi:Carnitinyl-CoA dehydratase [Mycobacterium sp. THAF192]|nr:Carnitinyl-CoA dehydratase [Mycobacterium sp. THAF192]
MAQAKGAFVSDEVLLERRGRTLIITINRPEARNAFNLAVAQGLADAVDELDDTPELSVAIITGAGGNFCAGMDLKAFMAGEVPAIEGRGIGFTERPPRKPLIAAVEGYALAGGTEIVLATDLIVAAKNAKFGIPEVKRGLVAAGGGLLRLQKRIPYQKALELALTGDSFTAEEASAWGFVNVLTEPGEALAGALALAERITANGPLAVAVTKEVMTKSADWTEAEMWKKQGELVFPVFSSKDAMEGATAFAEKRKPNWTGT